MPWFPVSDRRPYPIRSAPSTGGNYEIRQTPAGRFSVYRLSAAGNEHLGVRPTIELAKARAREVFEQRLAERIANDRTREYQIHFSGTWDGVGREETAYADTAEAAQSWRDDFLTRDGFRGEVTIRRWNQRWHRYE